MYEVLFYDTIDGKCPVQDFLDSLEPKILAKTLRTIDLLEANGPLLREPYSKHIQNGLFELRTKQGSDITRVFYFFFIDQKVVLKSSPNLCVHSSSSYVSPSMLPLSSGDLIEWSLVCHSTLSYQKFCDRHSNHYDHPEELHQSVE